MSELKALTQRSSLREVPGIGSETPTSSQASQQRLYKTDVRVLSPISHQLPPASFSTSQTLSQGNSESDNTEEEAALSQSSKVNILVI